MLGAGMIMGGTLLTIGLGALAAMSGKALMSAMLALGMSLMSAFRGAPRRCRRSDGNGCSGDGNDNYEIIARPVITHGHTHSAVLHHDPAYPSGYTSGYPSAGYPGYVRSLVQVGVVAASMRRYHGSGAAPFAARSSPSSCSPCSRSRSRPSRPRPPPWT